MIGPDQIIGRVRLSWGQPYTFNADLPWYVDTPIDRAHRVNSRVNVLVFQRKSTRDQVIKPGIRRLIDVSRGHSCRHMA